MNSLEFNEQNPDLLNTNGLRTNNNLLFSQDIIFFYENTKFLWKELMKINSTYIMKSKDISLLEPYVENILYSRLIPDDIDLLSNEYIVQLVTLLQLTGQYLAYTQKKLEFENQELRDNINELEINLKDNEKCQNLIDNLNRQNQEKDFLIKTYQNMIKNGYGINNGIESNDNDNINLRSKKDKLIETERNYYFCKFCAGKKFKSKKYLDEHLQRRHYNDLDSEREYQETKETYNREKNYKEIFDKKLNSLKDYFEQLIKQNQENNELYLINKKIDNVENQIISQNNARMYNHNNQNVVCKYCQQKLNQIPSYNINLGKNDQQNNNAFLLKEIKKLNDKLDKNIIEINDNLLNEKENIQKNKVDNNIEPHKNISNINSNRNLNRNRTTVEQTNIKTVNNIYSKTLNKDKEDKNIDINININPKKDNDIKINSNNDNSESYKQYFIPNDSNNQPNGNQKKPSYFKESIIENPDINININNQSNKQSNNQNNNKITEYNEDENEKNKNNENKNDNNKNNEKIINTIQISTKIEEEDNNNKNNLRNIDNKIIEESSKNEDKDKNESIIYSKKETSPKFSTKKSDKEIKSSNSKINDDNQQLNIGGINNFINKVKERDEEFYNLNKKDYLPVEIPLKYNVDNEEVNEKVLEKYGDDTSYDDFKKIDRLIDDYEKKLNKYNKKNKFEIKIYNALNLDDIIDKYKKYKLSNKNEKNKSSNRPSNIKIEEVENSNKSSEKKISINDNENEVTINANNKQDINNKNYILKSSTSLLMQNFENKSIFPKQSVKESVNQNIVIGHAITPSDE